jgi:transposase
MPKRTRRHFTAEQKVAILRLHLLEHKPVSDVCEQYDIVVNLFYSWQKQFFENGAAAFSSKPRRPPAVDPKDARIKALQEKLTRKNEVLSELMEEHVALKKERGEL